MYSVLIQDKKDKSVYRFLQVKEEVMEEVAKEVEDPVTHEVRTETELVGTIDSKLSNIVRKIRINLKKSVLNF